MSARATELPEPGAADVLYVVDLSGYVFRAYHAIQPLTSPGGEPTHAVYGTVNMLERLFKQHLDTLPSRHYLALRLARAQRLLQQSSQSILQIGLSSGFASGPHFSNAYKTHFGHTPRDERSRRALAWRASPPSGETS